MIDRKDKFTPIIFASCWQLIGFLLTPLLIIFPPFVPTQNIALLFLLFLLQIHRLVYSQFRHNYTVLFVISTVVFK